MSDFSGDTPEAIKIMLKREFGWMKTEKAFGRMVEVPMSTSEMTTVEFEKFMTQIRMWGDTQGIYLPEPNEVINER